MSTGFHVTSSELRSKAGELKDLNGRLSGEVQKMVGQEQRLTSMWEGEAQTEFHKAFQSDKGQMDEFSKLIDKYCEALNTIARKYDDAETRNVETARTRTYR